MRTPRWAWLLAALAILAVLFGAAPTVQDGDGGPRDLVAEVLGVEQAEAFPNGQPAAAEVAPINTGLDCPGLQGQLANPAAGAFNAMSLYAGKSLTINGCASAVRLCGQPGDYPPPVYGTQHYFWGAYLAGVGNPAARPCSSNHGAGYAIDASTATQAVLRANGAKFGWSNAEGQRVGESWHWVYTGGYNRPDPGPSLSFPILRVGSGGPGVGHYVGRFQELGKKHGCKLEIDRTFGQDTRRCAVSLQAANGAKKDGIVGEQTWKIARSKPKKDPEPPKPAPKPKGPVTGVDVSEHQQDVTWSKVRGANNEFAVIKLTEGQDYKDSAATQGRFDGIRKSGMVRGTYHYLRPRSDRTGAVEAAFYVTAMRAIGQGPGDFRPVVDVEETTLSPAGTCGYLRSFTRYVREQVGATPIVYTGVYMKDPSGRWVPNYLAGCGKWLADLPLWLPSYGVSKPTGVPKPWSGYAIHQFTSTGNVPGIAGDADVNRIPGGRPALEQLLDKRGKGKPASGGTKAERTHGGRSRIERRRHTERNRDVACGRRHRNAHGEPCEPPTREEVIAE